MRILSGVFVCWIVGALVMAALMAPATRMIQRDIESVNGLITLQRGVEYHLQESLVLRDGEVLEGNGATLVGGPGLRYVLDIHGDDVQVRDVTVILHNAADISAAAVTSHWEDFPANTDPVERLLMERVRAKCADGDAKRWHNHAAFFTVLKHSTFRDCRFYEAGTYGLWLGDCEDVQITNCEADHNIGDGIKCGTDSQNLYFSGCRSHHNGDGDGVQGDGIDLFTGGHNATITNCYICDNDAGGLVVKGFNETHPIDTLHNRCVTVIGCDISRNGKNGVWLNDHADGYPNTMGYFLSGNRIDNNGESGILCSGVLHATGNWLKGNRQNITLQAKSRWCVISGNYCQVPKRHNLNIKARGEGNTSWPLNHVIRDNLFIGGDVEVIDRALIPEDLDETFGDTNSQNGIIVQKGATGIVFQNNYNGHHQKRNGEPAGSDWE